MKGTAGSGIGPRSTRRKGVERLDRARIIRDKLLSVPLDDWVHALVAGVAAPTLQCGELNAVLWSQGNLNIMQSGSSMKPPGCLSRSVSATPLYRLDVWDKELLVLSMSWDEADRIYIWRLKHGDWEAAYFQLSLPRSGWKPSLH